MFANDKENVYTSPDQQQTRIATFLVLCAHFSPCLHTCKTGDIFIKVQISTQDVCLQGFRSCAQTQVARFKIPPSCEDTADGTPAATLQYKPICTRHGPG